MNSSRQQMPVIIGVGEVVDKPDSVNEAMEPLRLMEIASREAERDCGGNWLSELDQITVINQVGWGYRDIANTLKDTLGADHAKAQETDIGGEKPIRMLGEIAEAIVAGNISSALLVGAEALKSLGQAMATGKPPAHWSSPHQDGHMPKAEDYATELALAYGALHPIDVYPFYENAARAAWGQSQTSAQAESAAIWARMSEVACSREAAWMDKQMSVDAIATPSAKNRPVSFPYTKLMTAQLGVNQGAAVIITTLQKALDAGIEENMLVYIGTAVTAEEPSDFFGRDRYDRSAAMDATLHKALEENGLVASDLDAIELYSCFPCVPKMARRALKLSEDIPISVTGGLTFFGGPGNNYMTHSVAAMTHLLRGTTDRKGLLFGQGEFVTKHAAIVLRTTPFATKGLVDICSQVKFGEIPTVDQNYEGAANIETFNLSYGSGGTPRSAVIIARGVDGQRVIARIPQEDQKSLAELEIGIEPVGRNGKIKRDGDLLRWTFDNIETPNLSLAGAAVLYHKISDHIAIVELNRPLARNAVNSHVAAAIAALVDEIESDETVNVAILASTSPDCFCAGADLSEVAKGRWDGIAPTGKGFAGFVDTKRTKPWIAAVGGFALGGGTELALGCDLVVAAENAQFGLPEVKRGLLAAAGGLFRLPRKVPVSVAIEIALTGEPFYVDRAREIGFVNRVVPVEQLREAAIELANIIAGNAPVSVRESLKILRQANALSEEDLIALSVKTGINIAGTNDAKEGASAFMQKRRPRWTNS